MKKHKISVLFIILLVLSSCATLNKETPLAEVEEFSSDQAYMGINVKGTFKLSFKNLDTDEKYNFKVKNNRNFGLKIMNLPEGEYAITGIKKVYGMFRETLQMPVPLSMKTIFRLENNKILYLGDMHSTTKVRYKTMIHYMNFDYKWDDFIYNIEDNYYYNDTFNVTPIEYMTMNTKDESNFQF